MSTIVVGVDGSDASLDALRFALSEARLREGRVLVVYVWVFPSVALRPSAPAPGAYDEYRQAALELLDEVVASVAGEAEGVEIEGVAVEGTPSEELVARAEGSEMLVLGSRGLGGFAGLLLGSVGQQCAHHARCPVVIVHRGRRDGARPGDGGGR